MTTTAVREVSAAWATNKRAYIAGRTLWYDVAGALAAFWVTGSKDMLDLVYDTVSAVSDYMTDIDGDTWVDVPLDRKDEALDGSEPTPPLSVLLIGGLERGYYTDALSIEWTDGYMNTNLLANAFSVAAYALDVNRALDARYAAWVDWYDDWLVNDYLAERDARGSNWNGGIIDNLTHCTARGAVWLRFAEKRGQLAPIMTEAARDAHNAMLLATLVDHPNGSVVWRHRPAGAEELGDAGWQGVEYANDTMLSLVILALDGAIDQGYLSKMAKTVSDNIFRPGAAYPGLMDVVGELDLEGNPYTSEQQQSTCTVGKYMQAGLCAVTAWDATGKLALLNALSIAPIDAVASAGWMIYAAQAGRRP